MTPAPFKHISLEKYVRAIICPTSDLAEALNLISTDPTFSKYPKIKTALASREQSEIHFE